MRINVTGDAPTDGGDFEPIDPPPPLDIDDFFELEVLRESANDVKPFQEVDITWTIKARNNVTFADYIFTLRVGAQELATDLPASGLAAYSPHQSTVLRVVGRRRGGGDSSTLGEGLVLRVDDSDCQVLEIPSSFVDAQVIAKLSQLTSSTAQLRLRRRPVPRPGGGFDTEEMQVQPTWELGVIKYYFPLEVVLNNFFNADLDVRIEIRFEVFHRGGDTDLGVTIKHSSNVDFDTIENILSFGNSYTAAKTANRLIPLILECEARVLERDTLRQVLDFLGSRLDDNRLLYVRVVPLENFSYLAIALCPLAEEPGPGPVVVDPIADSQVRPNG